MYMAKNIGYCLVIVSMIFYASQKHRNINKQWTNNVSMPFFLLQSVTPKASNSIVFQQHMKRGAHSKHKIFINNSKRLVLWAQSTSHIKKTAGNKNKLNNWRAYPAWAPLFYCKWRPQKQNVHPENPDHMWSGRVRKCSEMSHTSPRKQHTSER